MNYLTVKEIQEILKISKNTVYTLVRQPDFPKVRIGKCIRIPEDEFIEYMRRYRNKSLM